MTQQALFTEYVLPRLRDKALFFPDGVPRLKRMPAPIDNLVFDELGKAVLAIHNERFHGIRDIEDKTQYQSNQPISFSNVPRALSYNQILHQLTDGRIHVASLIDVVLYWDSIPERATYADTDSIALFPKQKKDDGSLAHILALIEHNWMIETPLLIAGLEVGKENNFHGFTFIKRECVTVTEAPYLTKEGNVTSKCVAYDPTPNVEKLVSADTGIKIYSSIMGSKIHRIYRAGDSLIAWSDDLLSSNEEGRIHIVQKDILYSHLLEAKLMKK